MERRGTAKGFYEILKYLIVHRSLIMLRAKSECL